MVSHFVLINPPARECTSKQSSVSFCVLHKNRHYSYIEANSQNHFSKLHLSSMAAEHKCIYSRRDPLQKVCVEKSSHASEYGERGLITAGGGGEKCCIYINHVSADLPAISIISSLITDR